jgi:hypothetical protein
MAAHVNARLDLELDEMVAEVDPVAWRSASRATAGARSEAAFIPALASVRNRSV